MADLVLRKLERGVLGGDPDAFGQLQKERIRKGDLGYAVWAPSRRGRTIQHLWVPHTLVGFDNIGIDHGGGTVCDGKLLKHFLSNLDAFVRRDAAIWSIRHYDWGKWLICEGCEKAHHINGVPVLKEAHVLLAAAELGAS